MSKLPTIGDFNLAQSCVECAVVAAYAFAGFEVMLVPTNLRFTRDFLDAQNDWFEVGSMIARDKGKAQVEAYGPLCKAMDACFSLAEALRCSEGNSEHYRLAAIRQAADCRARLPQVMLNAQASR